MDGPYDVTVIGGGIVGCSAARELAPDHDVLVVERDQIAGDASGKASGVVSFSAQRGAFAPAVAHSLSFFRAYDGTGEFRFTERDLLELVPAANVEEAKDRVAAAREAGFPLEYLDADAVAGEYPGVFDLSGYVGGMAYHDTGWVDPYTTTVTYKDDAEDAGADVVTGVEVTGVDVRDGAVAGVETDDGRVACDAIVCAAGWATRPLLAGLVEVPVRPLRYQTLSIEPDEPLGADHPMGIDPETGFYWRPEHNGDLHLGGAEYLVEEPGSRADGVTEAFRTTVADELPGILQGFERARVVSGDTCPTGDAATPDSVPIVDAPADAPDGLVVATGFHGYGIMSSPAAGAGARALVTGEEPPFPLEGFALDRFDDRSADFGLLSLADKRTEVH